MTAETERRFDDWRPSRISAAAQFVLLLGAAAAVFLAGGPHEGNLGVFLVVAGLALVVCPPQARLNWKIWAIGAGLVLCASLALLPHDWLPNPEWRTRLLAAGVPLPASITPAPEETWFWLAILAIAIAVGLFGLMHPVGSRTLVVLAGFVMVIFVIYTSLAFYVHQSGWEYPFAADPAVFGFFHNRNHTATFLVTGSIAALGLLVAAFRGRHWLAGSLAAGCLAICIPSLIFFTTSRGGLVSLLIGTTLWLAGLGAAHRSKPLLISFTALFVGGVLLFLAPQSVVRHRLLALIGLEKDSAKGTMPLSVESSEPPMDARLLIFNDAFCIVRDYPLTGTGLGSFRYVFPQYRWWSPTDSPIVHPESDWLMLATEAGLPACFAVALSLGWLLIRVWRWREHPYWPLRWGIFCAGLAAFVHGFVDVPAHRTALGWWLLVIFALGFQTAPRDLRPPSRRQHLLFVLIGIGATALGVFLIRAAWFDGKPAAFNASFEAQTEIIRLRAEGDLPASIDAARRAIKRFPLAGWLHRQLGLTWLRQWGREGEVGTAFRAERLINPNSPEIGVEQGAACLLAGYSGHTLTYWTDAVLDRARIDQQLGRGEARALALYGDLVGRLARYEIQRDFYWRLNGRPGFALVALERMAPQLAAPEFPKLSTQGRFLQPLTETERRRFLEAWYRHGDREILFRFVDEHPDWESAAWPIQLRRLLDAGKFEEAIRAAVQYYKIDLNLPILRTSDADIQPGDTANPIEAFNAAWKKGNTIAAKRILDEARAGQSAPEIWRLSAAMAVHEGQWKSAWQYLDRYLREVRADPRR